MCIYLHANTWSLNLTSKKTIFQNSEFLNTSIQIKLNFTLYFTLKENILYRWF
jgi:hypothetical protein